MDKMIPSAVYFSLFFLSLGFFLHELKAFSIYCISDSSLKVTTKEKINNNYQRSKNTAELWLPEMHKTPPDYQCKNYPSTGSYYRLGEQMKKLFGGDKERILDFLYREMSLNREHSMHSLESLITLEQLLMAFDMYVRCGIFYQPAHIVQLHNMAEWPLFKEQFKEKYDLKTYYAEVLHHDHRLKTARPKVLEHVRNGDIIDMGSWCGDSLLVLSNYTDRKVYSYEYSPVNLKLAQKTLERYIPEGKAKIIHKGISNERKIIKSQHIERDGSTNVMEGENGVEIEMTTIDYEAKINNLKVGMIKGDIEGYELKALQGATEVLKRDRPIVTLSLYHDIVEFFGVPKLLRELDYEIEYCFSSLYKPEEMSEFVIFAYPSELL